MAREGGPGGGGRGGNGGGDGPGEGDGGGALENGNALFVPPADDKKKKKVDPFIKAGRISANAIKEGTELNLAALDEAIAQLTGQFGESADAFDPFRKTGRQSLRGLAGLDTDVTARGPGAGVNAFDNRIGRLLKSDAFRTLVDERTRNVTGLLGSTGNTRSGAGARAVAEVPSDVLLGLENQIFNRQRDRADNIQDIETGNINRRIGVLGSLADQGFRATGAATGVDNNLATLIAQLTGQTGAVSQSGVIGSADARANALLASAQQAALDKNASRSSRNNLFGTALTAGALALSDPWLKKNLQAIGQFGPLVIWEWDWREELVGTLADVMPTIGFLSTQVKKHFPDQVYSFDGFDVVDYDGVMEAMA